MWPTALQLTRDECRGILRRLELESYANVISVFRAQGGLTDNKAKLLDDLRNVFHISQERHRAEARRVANDEQLSTIAEAISGPNTYQEWSREGRRPYPLLPRVPPQTALCVVANHVAAEVTNENSQLPYPSDTANLQQPKQEFSECTSKSTIPVVTSDPLQPEIPDIRKTLKRNLPTEVSTSTKKRIVSEISPSATTSEAPLSPATQIRKLYHNHSKTQSKQKNTATKKSTNSPMKRPTAASAKKRLISGETVDSNKSNHVNTAALQSHSSASSSSSTTLTSSTNVELIPPQSLPPTSSTSSSTIVSQEIPTELQALTTTTTIPQIATSKKDISKNLSKLNLITSQPVQQSDKLPECKTEKLSTPVQKYIVDNRTPTLPTQFLDKQQVITSKMKPMTAIVPTPLSASSKAKVTSVKTIKGGNILCPTPVSSQPQVFNVMDASNPPYLPHTPPAIINISNKFDPEHGKVLKTKLLPLILPSGSKLESSNGSPGLNKTTPPTATVFRKPNIIKTGMPPIKQTIHITNQQIISPPTVASLKLSPHLHLKGVPGGGPIHNRNSVKIFSSSNGKMFIQSADNSAKQISKVNTIVSSQKGLVNTGTTKPRIAIQKVHIIPAPGAASTSATSVSNITMPKPMAIAKPNMIYMPIPAQQTMKGLPIIKSSNKFSTVLPTPTSGQEKTVVNPKSNVIVIGAVPSMTQTLLPKEMQKFSNRNNMITEDTPVDIITSPMIVDVERIGSHPVKPTETIDLTTTTETHKNPSQHSNKVAPVTVLPKRLNSETSYDDLSEKIADDTAVTVEKQDSMVIGVTDWEMELDQQASKSREINAEKVRRRTSLESILLGSGTEEGGSSDEHFIEDDVIEEHEETEEEMELAVGAERDRRDSKREREMTEKRRQEQVAREQHQYEEDEEESIEVGDEQMRSSEGDVIQYDESYESANDELDENIAIEYVEEEQEGYEEKIDSTSSDQKDTMECNSNIVLIKQSTNNRIAADPMSDSSEKFQTSTNDCMVSVEEISSTTQQNISGSQSDH